MENPFTLARIRKLQSLSYIEINNLTCHDFLRSEIEWLIRVFQSDTPYSLTLVNTGVAINEINVAVTVEYIG